MPAPTESSQKVNTPVVNALNQLLADSYVLMGNTHFAHWNVEGPDFFSLHKAFEEQYQSLFEAVDEIAERVRALDAYAVGGLRQLSDLAGIDDFAGPQTARDYVAGLAAAHEKTLKDAAALRDKSADCNDLETQDLAIGRIQWHQKTAWMLRSFLR